jgi:hypothetical protein
MLGVSVSVYSWEGIQGTDRPDSTLILKRDAKTSITSHPLLSQQRTDRNRWIYERFGYVAADHGFSQSFFDTNTGTASQSNATYDASSDSISFRMIFHKNRRKPFHPLSSVLMSSLRQRSQQTVAER